MTKILLVEDDKSLREIYGVRLLAEGYQIISAGDGEQALAMAVKERPDLIISDVMMPKISGFDMLDILRSTPETKELKVIMMTALSSEDQRSRGEALGANRYLVKSQVGIEDVVRTVHDVLADSPIASAPSAQIFGTPPLTAAMPARPAQPSAPTPTTNNSYSPASTPVAAPTINPVQQPTPDFSQAQNYQPAPAPAPTPAPITFPAPVVEPVAPVVVAPAPEQFATATPVQQAPEPYVSPEQKAVMGDRVINPINQSSNVDISTLINQELNGMPTELATNDQPPVNPNSQF